MKNRAGCVGCCLLSMVAGGLLFYAFLNRKPAKATPPARSHKKKPQGKVTKISRSKK